MRWSWEPLTGWRKTSVWSVTLRTRTRSVSLCRCGSVRSSALPFIVTGLHLTLLIRVDLQLHFYQRRSHSCHSLVPAWKWFACIDELHLHPVVGCEWEIKSRSKFIFFHCLMCNHHVYNGQKKPKQMWCVRIQTEPWLSHYCAVRKISIIDNMQLCFSL